MYVLSVGYCTESGSWETVKFTMVNIMIPVSDIYGKFDSWRCCDSLGLSHSCMSFLLPCCRTSLVSQPRLPRLAVHGLLHYGHAATCHGHPLPRGLVRTTIKRRSKKSEKNRTENDRVNKVLLCNNTGTLYHFDASIGVWKGTIVFVCRDLPPLSFAALSRAVVCCLCTVNLMSTRILVIAEV